MQEPMASGRKQGLIEADSSLHLKSKASAMAFTTTSRKALLVASLALCIGLAVTLGVLYGVYVGQEPASCKSYSAGNKGSCSTIFNSIKKCNSVPPKRYCTIIEGNTC